MKNIYVPTKSPEDWKKLLAEPDKHWRRGYSARTLAYCWEEANGIPSEVADVFAQMPIFKELETLIVIPEHQVPLPGGVRPSQNDCWVLSHTAEDLVSIAVEGKVSETFGPTIGEWLNEASPGKIERLNFLCDRIGLNILLPQNIRYQLLHRTASSVIEAKRFHARHAIMLVHSFSPTAERFNEYQLFASLFGTQVVANQIVSVGKLNNIHLYLAWVNGDQRYLGM